MLVLQLVIPFQMLFCLSSLFHMLFCLPGLFQMFFCLPSPFHASVVTTVAEPLLLVSKDDLEVFKIV